MARALKTQNEMMEAISDNILLFVPLMYKKLMKGGHGEQGRRASYLESPILCMLMNRGTMPISDIGRRLYISKPNMTPIVNKLISEGKVDRKPDKKDHRIINIAITASGRRFMKVHKSIVKDNIKRNIESLSEGDLSVLCSSLEDMKDIVSKISEED